MKHLAANMYDYHVWANEKTLEHLLTLPEEVVKQEVQSIFRTIHDVVVHICVVDGLWLKIFSGEFSSSTEINFEAEIKELSQLTLAELKERYQQLAEQYRTHVKGLHNLDESRIYSHPAFSTLTATYAEILMHIVNHATYHRGNISAMLHQLGYRGVPTDYVYYLLQTNK